MVPVVATALALYPIVRLRSVDRLFRVTGRSTSVARPVRVELSDYVGGWTRLLTWIAVAVAVGLATLLALLWRRGDAPGTLVAVATIDAAVALGLMGITHWFGRVLCDRPTPAVDASHLYLQDAWRATLLSRAHTNVGYICHLLFYGLLLSGSSLHWVIEVHLLPLVCLVISAWPLLLYIQPRQFRRRLWRTLPSGSVLLPGQPVPPALASTA
jgi:hypothetical protein